MALTSYRFHEVWTVDAPPERAWEYVADPTTYSRWWREFVEVTRLNEQEGIGARVAVHVKAALPYHMRFELESTRYDRPTVAEVRAHGDLNGTMRWTLEASPTGTRLTFDEEVYTGKQLLNVLAPLAKPFFAWNHKQMMRNGETGLRRVLAQEFAQR